MPTSCLSFWGQGARICVKRLCSWHNFTQQFVHNMLRRMRGRHFNQSYAPVFHRVDDTRRVSDMSCKLKKCTSSTMAKIVNNSIIAQRIWSKENMCTDLFNIAFLFNKLTSVFHVCVLLLITNFVMLSETVDPWGDSWVDPETTLTVLRQNLLSITRLRIK